MRGYVVAGALLASVLAANSITHGSLSPPRTIEKLVAESDAIVIGTVITVEARRGPDNIYHSEVGMAVEHYLLRPASLSRVSSIEVRAPGGRVGQMRFVANGEPQFELGQRSLLFLTRPDDGGPFQVTRGSRGKFTFTNRDSGFVETDLSPGDLIGTILMLLERQGTVATGSLQSLYPPLPLPRALSIGSQPPTEPLVFGCPCTRPSGVRWPATGPGDVTKVQFQFDPNVPSQFRNAIIAAAETWNDAGTNFMFDLNPPVASGQCSPSDGDFDNVVRWGVLPSGTPARTNCGKNASGSLVCCRLTFNESFNWSTSGMIFTKDVQGVATHEFGHWLELNHPGGICRFETMAAVCNGNCKRLRDLTAADKRGIQFTYGPGTTTLLPDLTVSSVEASPEFGLRFQINNRGCGPSHIALMDPFLMDHQVLSIRVEDGAQLPASQVPPDFFPISPKQRRYYPPVNDPPFDGVYFEEESFYRVVADAPGLIDERNENNNTGDSPPFKGPCPLGCDDGNVCTDDVCTGAGCEHNNNTAVCDDGVACTSNDACADGSCQGQAVDELCDDGDPCTADVCDAESGCIYKPNDDCATNVSSDPYLCGLRNGAGDLSLVWIDGSTGEPSVSFTRLDSNGAPLLETVTVSDGNSGASLPSCGVDALGNTHVVWQQDEGMFHAKLSSAGVLVTEPSLKVPGAIDPHVGVDAAGEVHMVWVDEATGRGKYREFNSLGSPIGGCSEQVYEDFPSGPIQAFYPFVLARGSGNSFAFMSWYGNNGTTDFMNVSVAFPDCSDLIGPFQQTNDLVVGRSTLVPLFTVSESAYQAFEGTELAEAQHVYWLADAGDYFPIDQGAGPAGLPTMAALNVQDVMVVWEDSRSGTPQVYAQAMDASASDPVGDNCLLSAATNGGRNPSVVRAGADQFAIAWDEDGSVQLTVMGTACP